MTIWLSDIVYKKEFKMYVIQKIKNCLKGKSILAN